MIAATGPLGLIIVRHTSSCVAFGVEIYNIELVLFWLFVSFKQATIGAYSGMYGYG